MKKESSCPSMDPLGLLRIRILKGVNLVGRDKLGKSDPYVVVTCGNQKVKTGVVKNNCNPVWDQELTLYIQDLSTPVNLTVYDKDKFSKDDYMGEAQIDIKHFLNCLKMGEPMYMALKLKNGQCGELKIQVKWIDLPRKKTYHVTTTTTSYTSSIITA